MPRWTLGWMRSPSLELAGLRRSFGDRVAVDGLSFSVPAGRCSGSSVATVPEDDDDADHLRFVGAGCGQRVLGRRADRRGVRERIGYMPEERGLYPKMRLGDQLEYFAVLHGASHEQGRAAALSWLDRLGLGDRVLARVEELSHGNQQRVQLAAALVHQPELLILDEPFAGLDPIATDVMAEVLREQAARGVPVLFSSHQLELVEQLCESVAIIDHGRLVACGEVDELRAGGPRLIRVDVRDAAAGWIDALPDVELVERTGSRTVLKLGPAADPQRILDAARSAGSVTHFARAAADARGAVSRGGVAMSARRAVWEVARRELVERSRSRVMRISVVLMLILSVGGAIAAARLSGKTPTDNIGLVGPRSVALEPAIRLQAKAARPAVRLQPLPARGGCARGARRRGRRGAGRRAATARQELALAARRPRRAGRGRRSGCARSTAQLGAQSDAGARALAPRALPVEVLDPNARKIERNRGLLAVGLIALLIVLVFYGQAVAQGVTEEKSSRVVELLLTTVSPRRLLAGKVLGIGMLGLAQLLLAGGAALAAGRLAGGAGLPSAAPETVALVLLWFVLGYVFYSVAFAAAGALVSRQEDLETAMTPITVVLIGAFYLALIVSNSNPNGTVARIAAFVPPFSPMVVPARMVLGDMTAVGLALAIAIDLLATAA